jgi:beta-ketodecanoyl-[acyl-carrier-protein] synthase
MFMIAITATGSYAPESTISNSELVASYNAYVQAFNKTNADKISSGDIAALSESSADFITDASGVKMRHVINKSGILDNNLMHPVYEPRTEDDISIQAEIAVKAAQDALQSSGTSADAIDTVICACSNFQRAYPAIAIEVQNALGCTGFAYDMNVACSSAVFALQQAYSLIKSGQAKKVLVVSPEICTAHLNFTDRSSHFIFGDVATAMLIESDAISGLEIIDIECHTKFSNNIRNNFGFLTPCEQPARAASENLFKQNGRQVFRDVTPWVGAVVSAQLQKINLSATDLKRLWLHQANAKMNSLIATKLLGHRPSSDEMPLILDQFANTSSAGSVLAMHMHKDIASGNYALLCAFGAGYSLGSAILRMST